MMKRILNKTAAAVLIITIMFGDATTIKESKVTDGVKVKHDLIEDNIIMKGSSRKINKRIFKKWQAKTDTQWNMKMINATGNAKPDQSRDGRIKVAVIDSGVDFVSDIEVTERKNFIPGQDDVSPLYEDGIGHGTGVAGIIAAKDNNEGITGINENVSLYSAKVLDENNQTPVSRVIEAVEWAISKNVKIINMSLGTPTYSEKLHNVIKKADQKGILIIAAAGNGEEVEYPAKFEETIAVGSVGSNGEISEKSVISEDIDVTAPGDQIVSCSAFDGLMASSGTSMAAPHVTGVASVLWQKNTDVPADFIRRLICDSARRAGEESKYGKGVVDLMYAVENFDEAWENYKAETKEMGNSDNGITEGDIVDKNEEPIECFEDNDIIEGRWTQKTHTGFIPNSVSGLSADNLEVLKIGAKLQDISNTGLAGKTKHPQFHGYHAHITKDKNKFVNYIACYLMLTKMAVVYATKDYSAPPKGNWINDNDYTALTSAIGEKIGNYSWSDVLGKRTKSRKNKALILYGMAIHTATDAFSHSAIINGVRLTDVQGHETGNLYAGSYRHSSAASVVKKLLPRISKNDRGYVKDFVISSYDHECKYKMAFVSLMAKAVNSKTYSENKAAFDALNIESFTYIK